MIDYYTYECFDDRRERFGYAILPLREVENMERHRWELKLSEMRFEAWRTNQATQRAERKNYGA